MIIYKIFLGALLFLFRLKIKIQKLSESEFSSMLHDSSLTYEQKILLIYFRYI